MALGSPILVTRAFCTEGRPRIPWAPKALVPPVSAIIWVSTLLCCCTCCGVWFRVAWVYAAYTACRLLRSMLSSFFWLTPAVDSIVLTSSSVRIPALPEVVVPRSPGAITVPGVPGRDGAVNAPPVLVVL